MAAAGCGGSKALPQPLAGDDLAQSPSSSDLAQLEAADLLSSAGDDLASSPAADLAIPAPPDMTTPPDLWMCTMLGGNCVHSYDCCAGNICDSPFNVIQPQQVCCHDRGQPCTANTDCCYGNNANGITMTCHPTAHLCG